MRNELEMLSAICDSGLPCQGKSSSSAMATGDVTAAGPVACLVAGIEWFLLVVDVPSNMNLVGEL